MKKAVFVDLDGTLLDCADGRSRISPYSREVFRRLQDRGISLFVASGRSVSFIPQSAREAGFAGYALVNGADVRAGERSLSVHTLDPGLMRRVTQLLEQEAVEYALQIPGGTWISRERTHILPYFKKYLFDERFLVDCSLEDCLERVMKLELFAGPEQIERCREILAPLESMYMPENNALEAYSRTVSKATGARELMDHLGIDRAETMCFGDAQNDLELFRMAGWSVAMGNACEEVRKQADDVCGCVGEDGVAHYLERYFFQNDTAGMPEESLQKNSKYIDKRTK